MGIFDFFKKHSKQPSHTENELLSQEHSTTGLPIKSDVSNIGTERMTLPSHICPNSNQSLHINQEIIDLVWIGDGEFKNYSSPQTETDTTDATMVFCHEIGDEPSALYLSLPVSEPAAGELVERPPYYPDYQNLSSKQRWMYWRFLAAPFSQENNIGYAFLFYYGLERHMLSGNLDKAFEITLKMREIYSNASFQCYSSSALALICIAKKRSDLALKLLESDSKNEISLIPINYLLILKYTFRFPLTVPEIIRNHQYFGFCNNRYIKGYPKLFSETFSSLLRRDFHADAIDLVHYFPVDIQTLPVEQTRMFANTSLGTYEIPIPILRNPRLIQEIKVLLEEAHETVKATLQEARRQGNSVPSAKPSPKPKLSPIETENIPKKLSFNLSCMQGCENWPNDRILEKFFELSETIRNSKEVIPRIEACEQSYMILKPVMDIFQMDSGEPPIDILCKECGPHLYMLLGDWDDAERAIKLCMEADAYDEPDDGINGLEYLKTYRKIADIAIEFIKKNPGFPQRDIYKTLLIQVGEGNISTLKEFMRETYVFHKMPYKGTNQLYYIERQ